MSSPPRWLSVLKDTLAVEKISPVVYTLATVDQHDGTPRARSVIHRSILVPAPSRPLLLTTTDIRSPKAHQLHGNPASEAVFWFPRSNSQLRIHARTYTFPAPSHPWRNAFPVVELGPSIDWEKQRLQAFDAISSALRASFVRPIPGSPLVKPEDAAAWPEKAPKYEEASTEEETKLVSDALANFALVVLDPTEVDHVELAVLPNRRTVWKKLQNGEWEESSVIP